MKSFYSTTLIAIGLLVLISGCHSWEAGWKQINVPSTKGDVAAWLEKAEKLIQSADTKGKVLEVVKTYESVLKQDPKNRIALEGAGFYSFLIAYGYPNNGDEKEVYLLKTIRYGEQLMYTNPDFAVRVDNGEKAWEACDALSEHEFMAIINWTLGVGIYWKEYMNGMQRLANIHLVFRFRKMLETMLEINPLWGNGTPYYALANHYAVIPGIFGGDMELAEDYYKKAIENGPDMLNFRRTRALFFHTKNKDREAFENDLNWVLEQDPHKDRDYLTYPYNVFIQRNARDLLNMADELFGEG